VYIIQIDLKRKTYVIRMESRCKLYIKIAFAPRLPQSTVSFHFASREDIKTEGPFITLKVLPVFTVPT